MSGARASMTSRECFARLLSADTVSFITHRAEIGHRASPDSRSEHIIVPIRGRSLAVHMPRMPTACRPCSADTSPTRRPHTAEVGSEGARPSYRVVSTGPFPNCACESCNQSEQVCGANTNFRPGKSVVQNASSICKSILMEDGTEKLTVFEHAAWNLLIFMHLDKCRLRLQGCDVEPGGTRFLSQRKHNL